MCLWICACACVCVTVGVYCVCLLYQARMKNEVVGSPGVGCRHPYTCMCHHAWQGHVVKKAILYNSVVLDTENQSLPNIAGRHFDKVPTSVWPQNKQIVFICLLTQGRILLAVLSNSPTLCGFRFDIVF